MIALFAAACVLGILPDAHCTPGKRRPTPVAEVCRRGSSRDERHVTEKVKRQVYAEYGIKKHRPGQYEVDHLISLELGGSNDVSNLWPEAAEPRPGFHEKDKLENLLHQLVCHGQMTLVEAQAAIATDWLSLYNRLVPGR